MPVPRPSEARLVIRHYEDGKMRVFLDGKPIPGVIGAEVKQEPGFKSVLSLSIIGMAYRMETSSLRRGEDRAEQVTPEIEDASQ
jgi:hypothetical protein